MIILKLTMSTYIAKEVYTNTNKNKIVITFIPWHKKIIHSLQKKTNDKTNKLEGRGIAASPIMNR